GPKVFHLENAGHLEQYTKARAGSSHWGQPQGPSGRNTPRGAARDDRLGGPEDGRSPLTAVPGLKQAVAPPGRASRSRLSPRLVRPDPAQYRARDRRSPRIR